MPERDSRLGLTLSAIVPEEPPVQTVIVTANGNAFQSMMTPWGVQWIRGGYAMQFDCFHLPWLELVAMHGPVTIVWLPEE